MLSANIKPLLRYINSVTLFLALTHTHSFELNNLVQLLKLITFSITNYFRKHNIWVLLKLDDCTTRDTTFA